MLGHFVLTGLCLLTDGKHRHFLALIEVWPMPAPPTLAPFPREDPTPKSRIARIAFGLVLLLPSLIPFAAMNCSRTIRRTNNVLIVQSIPS